jgi:hypothetical protein
MFVQKHFRREKKNNEMEFAEGRESAFSTGGYGFSAGLPGEVIQQRPKRQYRKKKDDRAGGGVEVPAPPPALSAKEIARLKEEGGRNLEAELKNFEDVLLEHRAGSCYLKEYTEHHQRVRASNFIKRYNNFFSNQGKDRRQALKTERKSSFTDDFTQMLKTFLPQPQGVDEEDARIAGLVEELEENYLAAALSQRLNPRLLAVAMLMVKADDDSESFLEKAKKVFKEKEDQVLLFNLKVYIQWLHTAGK